MSRVYFISDLHLGHQGCLKWARDYRYGENVQEMNQWLVDQANSVLKKRDLLYILGDVCFDKEDMHFLDQIRGRKRLILGNHDAFPLSMYEEYFEWVGAYKKYKGFWLSHMPINEYDIKNVRVKGNIHGHLHQNVTGKDFHYNVCVEQSYGVPVCFDNILVRHQQIELARLGE